MGTAAIAMAGMQVVQGQQQGQAEKAKAEFQANILNQNSRFAEMQAKESLRVGKEKEFESRLSGKRTIGAQRAALAAQGIELGSGSALDIQADTAAQSELDAITIRNNAFREAMGYRMRSRQLKSQARMARDMGSLAQSQSLLGGGLGAIGSFAQYGGGK